MTFVAPLFLIAAVAGAIPVLLHMINRQQASVVPFSTLRFLQVSVQRTRKRKYIHDMLLLLLRIAALVLIAIGLAGPILNRSGALFHTSSRAAVVVILDNSASMGTIVEGESRFDRAVHVAEQLVTQLRPGDSVALLTTGGAELPVQEKLYANQDVILQALGECKVSFAGADLSGKLNQARKLLATAKAAHHEIYVISDLQAVSWPRSKRRSTKDSDRDDNLSIVVIDVSGAEVPNVAIHRLTLEQSASVARVPIGATVELLNSSPVRQTKHVELYVDGARQATSPILELEPRATGRYRFAFTIDRPGVHRCEVRLLDQDALVADDRRYFAVVLQERIRVAVVEARTHDVPYLADAFYLKEALEVVSSGWAIEVDTLTVDKLAATRLADYAIVYGVNLPAEQIAAVSRLRDYVRQGGHLFWIAGSDIAPAAYNEMNSRAGGDLLPASIGKLHESKPGREEPPRITWIDGEHPALEALTEPVSLYQSILVRRYFRLDDVQQSGARVLARVGEDVLLAERAIGGGSVTWLGTSMHMEWTNLPVKPIFLPLVARLTFHLAGAQQTQDDLVAGTPWTVRTRMDGEIAQCEIERPDGQVIAIPNPERLDVVQYGDTHEAGVYQLKIATAGSGRELAFSTNVDPAESETAVVSHESVKERLGEGDVTVVSHSTDTLATIRRQRQAGSLWEVFLAGVLVALVAESLVANRTTTQPSAEPHKMVPERPRAVG